MKNMPKKYLVNVVIFTLALSSTVSQIDKDFSFTFQVSDVETAKDPPSMIRVEQMLPLIDVSGKMEDFSHRNKAKSNIVEGRLPGLVQALHTAYDSHYSLKLSVSDFIILIGQGFSRHINNHIKDLRYEFVDFEGQELIEIRRDEFIMGAQNDWSTIFGEFANEIRKRVKPGIYDVVIDDTSVSTPTSRIVSEVTLMDSMQGYFKYMVSTGCGIPQITLEGSREDWEKLRQKVQKLQNMNKEDRLKLGWWLEKLVPIVSKICDTAVKREVNKEFWRGIYKYEHPGSGDAQVSGWIINFFPYLSIGENNFKFISTDMLPRLVSEAPFTWNYYGTHFSMNFYGGFLGAQFNEEDLTIQPAHFWSVNFKARKKKNASDSRFIYDL